MPLALDLLEEFNLKFKINTTCNTVSDTLAQLEKSNGNGLSTLRPGCYATVLRDSDSHDDDGLLGYRDVHADKRLQVAKPNNLPTRKSDNFLPAASGTTSCTVPVQPDRLSTTSDGNSYISRRHSATCIFLYAHRYVRKRTLPRCLDTIT